MEDGVIQGGFGSSILEFAALHRYPNKIVQLGIPDEFPTHGRVEELHELAGISPQKITEVIQTQLQ